MKKIRYKLLPFLFAFAISIATYGQKNYTQTELDLQLQQKQIETLAKDIDNNTQQLENSIQKQDKLIEQERNQVSNSINILEIIVGVLGIVLAVFGFFAYSRIKEAEAKIKELTKETKNQMNQIVKNADLEVESAVHKVEKAQKEIDELKEEAETIVVNMKEHEALAVSITDKMKKGEELQPEEEVKLVERVERTRATKVLADYTAEDWFFEGYKAQQEDKQEEACFYYKKATGKDPANASTYYNWGNALLHLAQLKGKKGLLEEAETLFNQSYEKYEKATTFDSTDATVYNNWGAALLHFARLKGDYRAYQSEIEGKLLHAERLKEGAGSYNLACLYSLVGEVDNAIHWFGVALQKRETTRQQIENDSDLESIREDDRFKALLDKYRPIE